METQFFVPVMSYGQIAAGNVVPFTSNPRKKYIPLPQNAKPNDRFCEFEVSGDSLQSLGILDGDLLTCKINFTIAEIKPSTVCIVRIIPTAEETAKMVEIDVATETITLIGANPKYKPRTFFFDEIEILAIAVELRKKL